jgi:hypothetical protein
VLGCLTVTARGRLHRARGRFRNTFEALRAGDEVPTTATTAFFEENTSMSDSFDALGRANPRAKTGFAESIEAAAEAVRAQIATTPPGTAARRRRVPRRRIVGVSIAGASAAAGAAGILTLGSPGGGTTVESASAALAKAATVTASSAERSGTATVRITHDSAPWGATTVRWEGDVAIRREDRPKRAGDVMLLVDGTVNGVDHRGEWLDMGDASHIDRDSGTTPAEYLAAVREDVGGDTLRRFTGAMSNLSRTERDDGSVFYSGTVAAALLARETGFKEGQHIRVLPFGYVAHDEAADPDSELHTTVTTGAEGVVREIAMRWGTWRYTVTYSELGTTPAPVAPENTKSLEDLRKQQPRAER